MPFNEMLRAREMTKVQALIDEQDAYINCFIKPLLLEIIKANNIDTTQSLPCRLFFH